VHQSGELVAGVEPGGDGGPVFLLEGGQKLFAPILMQSAAEHVKAMGNERALDFVQPSRQVRQVGAGKIDVDRLGLGADHLLEQLDIGASGVFQAAPAFDQGLEFGKTLVEPGLRERRGHVADQGGAAAALGDQALGRVIGGVKVEVGKVADQPLGPAIAAEPGLFAGHEFERAMGAEVKNGVGGEILPQPAVKGRESVGRREAALEEQPHRIALIAEGWLDADEQLSKACAEHVDGAAVALLPAGSRAPLRFDRAQVRLAPDMIVGGDAGGDVGIGAEPLRIAAENGLAQHIDIGWNVDIITVVAKPQQGCLQRLPNREMGGGAGGACIGRKVKQHDRQRALGPGLAAQRDHAARFGGERGGAFRMAAHGTHRSVGDR
jgi:hypothetical protein